MTLTTDLYLQPTNLRNAVRLLRNWCKFGETCMVENVKRNYQKKGTEDAEHLQHKKKINKIKTGKKGENIRET